MDEPTSASVSAITATGASLLCGGALWLLCAPAPTEASESRRMNGAVWLAITLLIALLALCAVAYAVAHAGPLPVDLSLRDAVNVSTGNAPMQLALRIIGRFNRYRLWLVLDIALAGYLIVRRAWKAGGVVVAGAFLTEVVTAVLLVAVRRARPDALTPIQTAFDALSEGGFPPGPAPRSFVAVGMAIIVVAHYARQYFTVVFIVGVLLIALNGLAQVEIGVHWPTDVLGGYLEGVVCLAAVAIALRFRRVWEPPVPHQA